MQFFDTGIILEKVQKHRVHVSNPSLRGCYFFFLPSLCLLQWHCDCWLAQSCAIYLAAACLTPSPSRISTSCCVNSCLGAFTCCANIARLCPSLVSTRRHLLSCLIFSMWPVLGTESETCWYIKPWGNLAAYRASLLSVFSTKPHHFVANQIIYNMFSLNWLPIFTMTYGLFVICSKIFFIYTFYTKDDMYVLFPLVTLPSLGKTGPYDGGISLSQILPV